MNKIRIAFAFFSMLVVVLSIYFFITHKSRHQDIKETPEGREYLALMKDIMKKRDVQINFYGKIMDQHGQPVPNAHITIEIPHFSSQGEYFEADKTLHVKSNNKGLFTVHNQRGNKLNVESITKNGYEYSRIENPNNSFEYWRYMNDRFFIPNETNPVVFRMRKKQDSTYLIHWENFNSKMFYGNATEEAWHLDLVWPDFRPAHLTNLNVNYGSKPMDTDVIVQVRSNQTQNGYNVCFTVPDVSGGILETNVLMYTAPESGYQTNLVYYVPVINKEMFKTNTFFYIKARGSKVYARVNASFTSYGYDNGGVILDFQSWANPYGERNLEDESRLQYETKQRLHDEAEAALLQGKLPPKPNIQQLLKTEGEYKE